MKSVVLALALSLSTPPALAQSLPPSFTHSFSLGIAGCVELWGRDNGADVAGRGGCDNPGAQWFFDNGNNYFFFNNNRGSYALTTRSYFDGNVFQVDFSPFSGPMAPTSVAGNTWVVGYENHIYHSGITFDPTGGVSTQWYKVLSNARGDGFVVGSAAAGFPTKNAFQPAGSGAILAEFGGDNNRMVYATYLSSLGFTALPFMARDKGGNIYLAQGSLLVKLTSNVPQKVAYIKHLTFGVDSIAVDQYSQVYLESGSAGIPIVNSPQSTPGGPYDSSIVVLSPKGDRVVYSSYLGGDQEQTAGVDVDSAGNAHLGGVEQGFTWDGRTDCPNGQFNNCAPFEYHATFGPLNRSAVPSKLNFAKRTVGTATVLNALFKATGNVPSTVAGVTLSGSSAFTVTNRCTAAVIPDATCKLVVTFKPTATGEDTATLSVHSDSLDSPQLIKLVGTGK